MRTLIAILFFFISFFGQGQNQLFLPKTFAFKGDSLQYRIMFPENYNHKNRYPLVLFLHGSGERGSENELQLKYGAEIFTNDSIRKRFPAIVIFPQCPSHQSWVDFEPEADAKFRFIVNKKPAKPLMLTKKLLEMLSKTLAVDTRRIYVVGLSLGGMGTYDLICRYPKTFAAAIPICGAVDTERLKTCRKLPVRIYHGSNDDAVSVEYARDAYSKLRAIGAEQVDYIEFNQTGHDSWTPAFADPKFMSWLFDKKQNNKK